jgi:hypothetical protein
VDDASADGIRDVLKGPARRIPFRRDVPREGAVAYYLGRALVCIGLSPVQHYAGWRA